MKKTYEKPDLNVLSFEMTETILTGLEGDIDDGLIGSTGVEEW